MFGAAVLGKDETREQGRPTVETFGGSERPKQRRDELDELDNMNMSEGHEEVEDADPETAEGERSGVSGETTLRDAEGRLSKAGGPSESEM